MVSHMKTTVELPDALLEEAKRLAAEQDTTLKQLIATGLRHVIKSRTRPVRFELREAGFRGSGLQPEFRDASWKDIRDAIYEEPASRGEPTS